MLHRHGLPALPGDADAPGAWRPYVERVCASLNAVTGPRSAQLAACDANASLCERKGAARHEAAGPAWWGTTGSTWSLTRLLPWSPKCHCDVLWDAVGDIRHHAARHLIPY